MSTSELSNVATEEANEANGASPPLRASRPVLIDVISALRAHDGKFPAREQNVADYVKQNIEAISKMTIGDLAESCNVSKPTVIRFCRTLGCEGFPDFKLRLAQNLAVSAPYLSAVPETRDVAGDMAIDRILSALFETIDLMRREIDPKTLDVAKVAIVQARQIIFAGIGGGSSSVVHEAANRFFRLGIPSTNISDSYVLLMRAATLRAGDVLFLVSTSGEADAILSAEQIAREYGATTVAITRPGSSLAKKAKISIVVDPPDYQDIYKPTASRYAHLIIVDALAMAVAHEKPDETSENLRRIRASLTAYHGRTGPQPLGD